MTDGTTKVAIVATPGCIGSTVHGVLDVFACANVCASQRTAHALPFEVRVASPDGQAVSGYNRRMIEVDGDLSVAKDCDVILLAPIMPALSNADAIASKIERLRDVTIWLRARAGTAACIATSCTGSFLLAEAGLLDGKVATTHWHAAQIFRTRYPRVLLREGELVTEDGNLVCGGGALAYVDLAIHLVRRFGDPQLALHCARMLVFDPGRQGQSPYLAAEPRMAHGDRAIHHVQAWLETNYWRDLDVESVAQRFGMSSRTLKRRFKAACGEPFTNYLQRLRVVAARDRLATSDASIQQIILDVGYSDISSFGRLFKAQTGTTMAEYRRRLRIRPTT
jgi:transcriptional regulator GlxA family with amidase domain